MWRSSTYSAIYIHITSTRCAFKTSLAIRTLWYVSVISVCDVIYKTVRRCSSWCCIVWSERQRAKQGRRRLCRSCSLRPCSTCCRSLQIVAQVMTQGRFEKITSHLHIIDNDAATTQTIQDKCWTVRPWLSELRENMLKIPQKTKCSSDEILICFRGRLPIQQYLRNKPKCKWGLKLWARAGVWALLWLRRLPSI